MAAAEAIYISEPDNIEIVVPSGTTYNAGDVIQLPDGRAAIVAGAGKSYVGPTKISVAVRGVHEIAKTASLVFLDGGRCYWDHSANKSHFKPVNDRDFYVGVFAGDAASAAATCQVNLNVQQVNIIDLVNDPGVTAIVGTQAVGGLAFNRRGGTLNFPITATNEAQKIDLLSKAAVAVGSKPIVEFIFAVPSDGAGTVVDVSVGLASATHASDADAIAEHLLMHLDANNTNINFQSKTGALTVAAADSTKDYVEGATNQVHVWLDLRNSADARLFVDGVEVLAATAWDVSGAAGPWKLLAHVEKSASTDTYEFEIDRMVCRIMQQGLAA